MTRQAPAIDIITFTILKLKFAPTLPKPNCEAIKPPTNEPIMPKMIFPTKELWLFMIMLAIQPTKAPNNNQSNIDTTIEATSLLSYLPVSLSCVCQ